MFAKANMDQDQVAKAVAEEVTKAMAAERIEMKRLIAEAVAKAVDEAFEVQAQVQTETEYARETRVAEEMQSSPF